MKKLLFVLLILSNQILGQVSIIPQPKSIEISQGSFFLDKSMGLSINNPKPETTEKLKIFLAKHDLSFNQNVNSGNTLVISEVKDKLDKEAYTLEISPNIIKLSFSDQGGLHNGLQSLTQLIRNQKMVKGQVLLPTLNISDSPRFGWRGLMLDVSRNFFTVEEVKAYIDLMSEYKLNILHWHLTDDEGWRIEIKSLPKLTEVGAWRVPRNGRFGEGRAFPTAGEKATVGGFYTQDQIKDVVTYALARNINIVPEIDIPGHSMAALAAYPELSTKKDPKFVNPGSKFSEWYGNGTFKMLIENTLNPADEAVYGFVDKVMTEVAALFPYDYIHMGGDECYHGYWEKDKKVQAFMKANGLKDSHALQSYFVSRVNKIVNNKGKKMIGWDEILEGGLTEGAAVMSWRGVKGGIEAAKKGHQVVMSPTTHAYLDYTQGDKSVENPIYNDLSLSKTYSFEPVPDGVEAKYILGTQGNLWTEVIPTLPFAFYMTYPRAFAISENAWSPASIKDYSKFMNRVEDHVKVFENRNISIAKNMYEPAVKVYKEAGKTMIAIEKDMVKGDVYYSTDNTYPVNFSQKYIGPFEKPSGDFKLRTQLFLETKALGRELIISNTDLDKRIK